MFNLSKTSQLAYFIFISDKPEIGQQIQWNSYQSERSTWIFLCSEVIKCADAFDLEFILKHGLKAMFKPTILLFLV